MTFKMSHDRFLSLLGGFPKDVHLFSLSASSLFCPHTQSFAANECIDNIPIAATWILSCLVFGISLCIALHTLQEHVLSFCFNDLLVLPWTRLSARFLSPLICHNWRFLEHFCHPVRPMQHRQVFPNYLMDVWQVSRIGKH